MKTTLTKIRQIALLVSGWNIENVRDEMVKIIDLCDAEFGSTEELSDAELAKLTDEASPFEGRGLVDVSEDPIIKDDIGNIATPLVAELIDVSAKEQGNVNIATPQQAPELTATQIAEAATEEEVSGVEVTEELKAAPKRPRGRPRKEQNDQRKT